LVERIKYKKSKREYLLKEREDFRSKFDRFARDSEVVVGTTANIALDKMINFITIKSFRFA
jgi:hypothetical protein